MLPVCKILICKVLPIRDLFKWLKVITGGAVNHSSTLCRFPLCYLQNQCLSRQRPLVPHSHSETPPAMGKIKEKNKNYRRESNLNNKISELPYV